MAGKEQNAETLLGGYRVLDLTNERGFLCGKILGDLGADVIKIEPPGGDPARNIGPFYKDIAHPEKSLLWFALNTSKRGITLNIETTDGGDLFKRLVKTADFVIESFEPDYMDNLGLGYSELEKINSRLIVTSITPFGSTGPYAHYKASDLTLEAMGGFTYLCGEPDKPPCRVSLPQAYLLGGLHGAMGSMIAHYYRESRGEGQHIDVSIQQAIIYFTDFAPEVWDILKINNKRSGPHSFTDRPQGQLRTRWAWRCKDGYVMWLWRASGKAWLELMGETGTTGDLKVYDWVNCDPLKISQEEVDRMEEDMAKLFLSKTKEELYQLAKEKAVGGELHLAPINTVEDTVNDPQLHARGYFVSIEHPELNDVITYPGLPFKLSEAPWEISRRAPLIGEHNEEILEKELALPRKPTAILNTPVDSIPVGESKKKKQALDGIKVVDLTWIAVGPQITKTLAEHGATVVRIESHRRPDLARAFGPRRGAKHSLNTGVIGSLYNVNKYNLSLDLTKPRGKEIARKLIGWADVVVEGFSAGTMKKLGLDYDEAKKIKPDIIYGSTTFQGQAGGLAGRGYQGAALAGLVGLTGYPDGEPAMAQTAYVDYIAPWYMVTAITAALDRRRRTGRGMYIDHAQYETGVTFLAPAILDYTVNGRIMTRNGNRDPNAAPHGIYPCHGNDRWVAIAVFTDDEWQAFCQVIGNPEWTMAPRFATMMGRKEHEDELDQLVADWTINYAPEQVMSFLQPKGVAAGVVNTAGDLFSDPQLQHRGHFVYLEQRDVGYRAYENEALKFSKTPQRLWKAGPSIGEDNEYICKEILGLADNDISDLISEGVLTTE